MDGTGQETTPGNLGVAEYREVSHGSRTRREPVVGDPSVAAAWRGPGGPRMPDVRPAGRADRGRPSGPPRRLRGPASHRTRDAALLRLRRLGLPRADLADHPPLN